MIKKFICWFWGCHTIVKAFTGETMEVADRLAGGTMQAGLYRWEEQKFCLRCNKPNEHYKKTDAIANR